jgi:hypothetical protein
MHGKPSVDDYKKILVDLFNKVYRSVREEQKVIYDLIIYYDLEPRSRGCRSRVTLLDHRNRRSGKVSSKFS